MSRNQRKIGVLLSYMSQMIQILSSLLYTPIMLRSLGQSEYGLYQLVYSVVSYMGLLSFGFSSSYMRFYSQMKVKNDEDGIAKLNGMFMTIFISISLICVLCGTIMISNITLIFGDGLTSVEYSTARVLMALMVLNLAINFPNSVFDSILSSKEKFIFQKAIVVFQNLLNPFITLPLLIMGYGSIAMVAVTTILTLVKLIVNIVYCIKKLYIRFEFKKFDFGLLRRMWIFTFYIFVNMIVDQINWSVDKFLLGRMAGTTAVAIYGVGGQINSLYLQLSTAVSNVFIPKVNQIVASSDDNKELTLLFTKVGRIQCMILALVLSGFVLFGKRFVELWAGEGYEIAYQIAIFLMAPVTIPLIQNLGIEIQRAKNMHKARSYVYLLIAVSNIFVSIPCIIKWGAQGAAIGTALSMLCGNGFFMNWYYHKKIGIDIVYFWKNIGFLLRAMFVPVILGILIVNLIKIKGFITLLCGILIYSIVYFISIYVFGMNLEEKQLVRGVIKKIIRK